MKILTIKLILYVNLSQLEVETDKKTLNMAEKFQFENGFCVDKNDNDFLNNVLMVSYHKFKLKIMREKKGYVVYFIFCRQMKKGKLQQNTVFDRNFCVRQL